MRSKEAFIRAVYMQQHVTVHWQPNCVPVLRRGEVTLSVKTPPITQSPKHATLSQTPSFPLSPGFSLRIFVMRLVITHTWSPLQPPFSPPSLLLPPAKLSLELGTGPGPSTAAVFLNTSTDSNINKWPSSCHSLTIRGPIATALVQSQSNPVSHSKHVSHAIDSSNKEWNESQWLNYRCPDCFICSTHHWPHFTSLHILELSLIIGLYTRQCWTLWLFESVGQSSGSKNCKRYCWRESDSECCCWSDDGGTVVSWECCCSDLAGTVTALTELTGKTHAW